MEIVGNETEHFKMGSNFWQNGEKKSIPKDSNRLNWTSSWSKVLYETDGTFGTFTQS